MEKSELKIKKNSCCVTAFYSLFEKLLVVIHVNTSYLDIHVLAWIELKIDNFFIINIPGPSQKKQNKTKCYISIEVSTSLVLLFHLHCTQDTVYKVQCKLKKNEIKCNKNP